MSTISKRCGAVLISTMVLAASAAQAIAAPMTDAGNAGAQPVRAEAMMLSEPVLLVVLGGGMVAVALFLRHRGDRSRG
jgi:hypothetical protein